MKAITIALLLFTSACLVSTSSPPPSGPPPSRDHRRPPPRDEPRVLVGTITDAATGAPLARAAVDVVSPLVQGEITVNTGPDGRYRTRELPPGDFKVRCRRDGYESINREVRVDRGTAVMDCPMQRKR